MLWCPNRRPACGAATREIALRAQLGVFRRGVGRPDVALRTRRHGDAGRPDARGRRHAPSRLPSRRLGGARAGVGPGRAVAARVGAGPARRRRRPVGLRAAPRPRRRGVAAVPALAGAAVRPRLRRARAGRHRAEGHGAGGLRRLPRARAALRRAGAGAVPGAHGAADRRRLGGDPVVGLAAGLRRRRALAHRRARRRVCRPARAGRVRVGRRGAPSPAGAARHRGLDARPRSPSGRSATPTRSRSATTTWPRTSAGR